MSWYEYNMNNTRTTLAIVAVLTAATLVVGGTFVTAALAASSNNSGNTVTIQKGKQDGTQSGFDNTQEQEDSNVICTHPGENAACSQEGAATPTSSSQTGTGTLFVEKVVKCLRTLEPSIISTCPPASEFTITVTGNNPIPSTFHGSADGTLVTLGVGAYKVNEEPFLGFDTTFSADCTGTIAPGDQKTCIVTNTQQEP
jgi:hypothetical protein